MKLSIYVHDFQIEIGHTRAMIDLLNGLSQEQKDKITSITILSFTSGDVTKLLPDFKNKIRLHLLPFKKLKPFLIKMLFYHAASFIHSLLQVDSIKIGIGIANLNVDISNIQFIHQQWNDVFFKQRKLSLLPFLYKKILFSYFAICEHFFFQSKNRKYILIANFMKKFLFEKYHVEDKNQILLPSSVDMNRFNISKFNKSDQDLMILNYPILKNINFDKPILLFVGAFERKGLDKVLRFFKTFNEESSLIVIGKSEDGKIMSELDAPNIFYIPFTKEVEKFYNLSDYFLFPTYYEPFGLVIIEAYAMGMNLVVPDENVGASEIIEADEGIVFIKQSEEINLKNIKKITFEERKSRRNIRAELIAKNDWSQNANKFYSMLESI